MRREVAAERAARAAARRVLLRGACARAVRLLRQLCAVVEAEGYLCSTVLADRPLTNRYKPAESSPIGWEDFTAHVRLLEASTPHIHVWTANVYRGATFGSLFTDYAKVSGRPLLIGEYGIDAFDASALPGRVDEEVCERRRTHASAAERMRAPPNACERRAPEHMSQRAPGQRRPLSARGEPLHEYFACTQYLPL